VFESRDRTELSFSTKIDITLLTFDIYFSLTSASIILYNAPPAGTIGRTFSNLSIETFIIATLFFSIASFNALSKLLFCGHIIPYSPKASARSLKFGWKLRSVSANLFIIGRNGLALS